MSKKIKKVSFLVLRGVRLNGQAIFPAKEKSKKTVVSIPLTLAKELQAANKGKIVEDKVTTVLNEPEDDDGLDDMFGAEDDEKDKK